MQKRMPMVSAEECIFVHKKELVLASPFCVTFFSCPVHFYDALCLTHTVQCALKRYLFYFFPRHFVCFFVAFGECKPRGA